MADPPPFVSLMEARKQAPNGFAYGGPAIAAEQQKGYPDLKPLVVKQPPKEVVQRAIDAARAMGWEIVASDAAAGRIEATDTTAWFGFKDDIVVRIRPEGEGSRVDVRSVSRVGLSDLGANAEAHPEFPRPPNLRPSPRLVTRQSVSRGGAQSPCPQTKKSSRPSRRSPPPRSPRCCSRRACATSGCAARARSTRASRASWAGLHAALRAGARGPRHAGIVVQAHLHARRDRGDAGGLHRGGRCHGRHGRRNLRRHPVRAHEEARRGRARHRRRAARRGGRSRARACPSGARALRRRRRWRGSRS